MNRKKITIPNIRFEGFTEEWKRFKLKDLGFFYYGKSIPKTESGKRGKTPCVRYGELYSTYNEFIDEVKTFTNLDKNNLKISQGGEVLVPRVGEDPLDFANCSFLPHAGVAIGEMISVYNTKESGLFITYYINVVLKNELARLVEGFSVHNLYFRYLEDLKVNVPEIKEQQKIEDCLTIVDNWIDNLKKQKDAFEKYKKGMMQKIFSQEIRFRDDHGRFFSDWQESLLGDLGVISTSGIDKKIKIDEYPIKLLNYMDVYRKDYICASDKFQEVTATANQINRSNLKFGDILFTPSSETPTDIGHSAVVMEDLPKVVFSYHLVRFRPKKNILLPLFSAYAFKSFVFYKKLWILAQGATRYTLSLKSLNEVSVLLPSSKIEQEKIATYLNSIDKLIELTSSGIEKAEKWKKGLMQNLFV